MGNENAEETIIILFICTVKCGAAECSFFSLCECECVFVGNEVVFGALFLSTRQKWHIPTGEWHDRDIAISMVMSLVHMSLLPVLRCIQPKNNKMCKSV